MIKENFILQQSPLDDSMRKQLGELLYIIDINNDMLSDLINDYNDKETLSDKQQEQLENFESIQDNFQSIITAINDIDPNNVITPVETKPIKLKSLIDVISVYIDNIKQLVETLNPVQQQTIDKPAYPNVDFKTLFNIIKEESRKELYNIIPEFNKVLAQAGMKVFKNVSELSFGNNSWLLEIGFENDPPQKHLIFQTIFDTPYAQVHGMPNIVPVFKARIINYQEAMKALKKIANKTVEQSENIDPKIVIADNLDNLVTELDNLVSSLENM